MKWSEQPLQRAFSLFKGAVSLLRFAAVARVPSATALPPCWHVAEIVRACCGFASACQPFGIVLLCHYCCRALICSGGLNRREGDGIAQHKGKSGWKYLSGQAGDRLNQSYCAFSSLRLLI